MRLVVRLTVRLVVRLAHTLCSALQLPVSRDKSVSQSFPDFPTFPTTSILCTGQSFREAKINLVEVSNLTDRALLL